MNVDTQKVSHWRNIFWLVLIGLVMFSPGLSSLPVIDRDESRFAQASVQMAESGDMVNIRFQDEARNKKPAGAYWAQTAFIKIFSKTGERRLWAQRLPSVLGALLAMLATYWAGIAMIGRRGAAIGAGLLGMCILFIFEAHIAKTDAMLCASGAFVLVSLACLRQGAGRRYALLFWVAMGIGILLKGPVIPAITLLTILTLAFWERHISDYQAPWIRRLFFWPGPILCLLFILPWMVLIYQETNGQFFIDALGGDFGSKLISGQENHGAPLGTYLLTLPIFFWPASLLLLPGLSFAVHAVSRNKESNTAVVRAMRLALAWVIPYWIILEIVPTKLPNYLLPVYPALAIMCGGAVLTLFAANQFKWTRRIGAVLFCLIGITLAAALPVFEASYGGNPTWSYVMIGLALIAILMAACSIWIRKMHWTLISMLLCSVILMPATFGFLLPSLSDLSLANKVERALIAKNKKLPREGGPLVLSPNFTEPSLVYRLGTQIVLGGKIKFDTPFTPGTLLINDLKKPQNKIFLEKVKIAGNCTEILTHVDGFNYVKGKAVDLQILEVIACPPLPAQPIEAQPIESDSATPEIETPENESVIDN